MVGYGLAGILLDLFLAFVFLLFFFWMGWFVTRVIIRGRRFDKWFKTIPKTSQEKYKKEIDEFSLFDLIVKQVKK